MGAPFDDQNQGSSGALTLWEQLDEGAPFTRTKKFLTVFPIILFLISTHYSRYDPSTFAVNFVVLLIQLIAKLPMMHRVRILGINKKAE